MDFERFVGLRYLLTKKRSQMVSIITLIAIAGVALGVMAMIVVLSVMGGFEKDLKEKILGTKAHIVVTSKDTSPLDNIDRLLEQVRNAEGVAGASPFVEKEVMASSPTNLNGVILRGINIDLIAEVSELDENIVAGKLKYLRNPGPLAEQLEKRQKEDIQGLIDEINREKKNQADETSESTSESGESGASDQSESGDMRPIVDDSDDEKSDSAKADESGSGMRPISSNESEESTQLPGLILGSELARSLQVDLGAEVNVVTPEGDIGPTGKMPKSRPFKIVGTFKTGMYEYDANQAYTSIEDARDFTETDGATGIELKTVDVDRAKAIADRLQKSLPEGVVAKDWRELNQSLFFALRLEKIAMFIVLAFIILVASFSIVAMLIMTVIEKSQDIAVLKAMGATRAKIMRIFVLQGTLIGGLGAVVGLGLGLAICWFLAEVGLPLNSEVYYISNLPVDIDFKEIGLVLGCTVFISMIATVYPSFLAAKLNPIEGLRDE
jgi:lipoprotein-releasing system permease protein